ncbi:MAG TPA: 23S rRNA (cytosine(1962)-C(5))-methyltransferase RlmI [Rheinheimera sp.]|uniref:class I SAM-dependent rRNA methyltransferase n=1 Tax=Rheinheimera sp. TaxID=1869214 RepID=UPI000EC7F9DB|nr:class I SAM-dependent methyltransferase [Rheinheimera sp.]HCU66065.1 23S rRNA (cytosine(1962)-C(5))-methyltransferase RlmI [Rheinheimera sp.]
MTASIILQNDRDKSLKRRHPWVFSQAVKQVHGTPNSGDTVDILSADGKFVARGAYSPNSQIRARVWTFDQNEQIDAEFFLRRIAQAWAVRQQLFDLSQTNGIRVVAAESDSLPGVTIDLYADVLVCQLLSAGAERQRKHIVAALKQLFDGYSIYERSDVDVRKKEGLEPRTGWLHLPRDSGEVTIKENGLNILVDVVNGHKTGFYLDQRDSRAAAGRYAKGKTVLNCFSYTGTFGLAALTGGATHVTNADLSDLALATAQRNMELNQLDLSKATMTKADVFKLLRQYKDEGKQFDMVILDPPKFAENKSQLVGACRGYKDINRVAMQIVKPGGLLLTFSCSGLMEESLFQKVVADAALDANRGCLFIERLSQAKDHPIASFYPEGHYLKGLVCIIQ